MTAARAHKRQAHSVHHQLAVEGSKGPGGKGLPDHLLWLLLLQRMHLVCLLRLVLLWLFLLQQLRLLMLHMPFSLHNVCTVCMM
jgi:hypothetical protein